MNISKTEQRVLHVLAQGGRIVPRREAADQAAAIETQRKPRIVEATCFTRDGHVLADCTLGLFQRLRRRRLIFSIGGGPYHISRDGLSAVRAQLDNR